MQQDGCSNKLYIIKNLTTHQSTTFHSFRRIPHHISFSPTNQLIKIRPSTLLTTLSLALTFFTPSVSAADKRLCVGGAIKCSYANGRTLPSFPHSLSPTLPSFSPPLFPLPSLPFTTSSLPLNHKLCFTIRQWLLEQNTAMTPAPAVASALPLNRTPIVEVCSQVLRACLVLQPRTGYNAISFSVGESE